MTYSGESAFTIVQEYINDKETITFSQETGYLIHVMGVPTILKENGVYYLAIKNENTCKNVVYKSNSLLNGYSKIKEFDDIAEGISIIKFNDKYYTYVSIYNANHTLGNGIGNGLYMSNDLVNWSELTQIKNSGDSINRHFTPMVITTEQQKTIVNNFLKMYGNDTLVDFEKNKSYILANANENKTHNNLLLDPNATYSVSGTSTVTINQLDTSLLKTGDLVHFFIRNNGGSICFKYNSNNKVWWSDTNDFNVTGENGFGCTVITLICNKNGEAYFNTTSDKNIIKTVSVGNGLTLKLTKKNGVVIGNISGNTTLFANTDVGVNNIIPTGFRPSYTSAFVSTQSINGSHPINGLTIKTDGRIEYFSTEERSNTWFICNFSYICS